MKLNPQRSADQPAYDPTIVYKDFSCKLSLQTIYIIYVILWGGYFLAAVYLDNVWPNERGNRRPLWYFLLPSYWARTRRSAAHTRQASGGGGPRHARACGCD